MKVTQVDSMDQRISNRGLLKQRKPWLTANIIVLEHSENSVRKWLTKRRNNKMIARSIKYNKSNP